MSQGSVRERILFLRRSIAAIEARDGSGADAWLRRSNPDLGRGSGEVSRDPLERLLDNSISGSSSEILPACPADAAAAASFAFALALRSIARPGAGVVWIAEDMVAREIGLPYGRGLEALGFDPRALVLVRTKRPRETLWAMEEALESRAAAAVLAETWISPAAYDLVASRRLAFAARRGGGAGLLFLPRAAGEAQKLASAAHIRFEIASFFSQEAGSVAFLSSRLPLPGPLAWRVRIAKARAGLLGGSDFDPQCWRDLVFDHEKAVFRHALPLRFPASPADRSDRSPAAGGTLRESA